MSFQILCLSQVGKKGLWFGYAPEKHVLHTADDVNKVELSKRWGVGSNLAERKWDMKASKLAKKRAQSYPNGLYAT